MAELPLPACEACDGRGWIVVRDGGAGSAKPCSCRVEEPVESRMRRAGVRSDLLGASFESWDSDLNGPIPAKVLSYAGAPTGTLTLVGDPGRGKSFLAAAVMREVIQRMQCRWCYVRLFLREIKRSQNFEWRDQQVASLEAAAFVVLDDLGTERTDYDLDTTAGVIDTRYVDRLPGVYTSNMGLRAIHDREPRIASRLAGGTVVELEGKDYRPHGRRLAS